MKNYMLCLTATLSIGALGFIGCSNSAAKSTDSNQALSTDSIAVTDSVVTPGYKAEINISGQYPQSGSNELVSGVRTWLGSVLTLTIPEDGSSYFTPTADQLANGKSFITEIAGKLKESASSSFKEMGNEGGDLINYSYTYKFRPSYQTNNVVTYTLEKDIYLGGAHPSQSIINQSFFASNGKALSSADIFQADKMAEVQVLVKEGLKKQYFEGVADTDELVKDLLANDIKLPVTPPALTNDGVKFIYQQDEIGPYAIGMPECTIIYSDIKELLTPEVAKAIAN